MPFPAIERLRELIIGDGLTVDLIGNSGTATSHREPIAYATEDGQHFESSIEIVFPRAAGEESYTTWRIYGPDGVIEAYDKLERPILLRKGERATFPPGALRLELK